MSPGEAEVSLTLLTTNSGLIMGEAVQSHKIAAEAKRGSTNRQKTLLASNNLFCNNTEGAQGKNSHVLQPEEKRRETLGAWEMDEQSRDFSEHGHGAACPAHTRRAKGQDGAFWKAWEKPWRSP